MPLPLGDHLHVDALFDAARDEHPAQRPVTVRRQVQPLARVAERLARVRDREQSLAVSFALAQFLDQLARLREDRNREAHRRFSPEHDHATGLKIHVGAPERRQFRLSESEQSESFDEVAAFLSVRVEPLRANVGDDRFELVERRRQSNRRGALAVLKVRRRTLDDDAVAHREVERAAKHRERRVVVALALVAVVLRQPRFNLRGFDRAQWQRVDAEPRRAQLVDDRALVRLRRRRQSAERAHVRVEHRAEAGVAGARVGAAKVAPVIGQLAPRQLVVGRAEFFAVELAAEADTCEVLAGWIVTVKTSGFGLSPSIV